MASEQVSISDFVSRLREFPQSAFDRVDDILRFLRNTPVHPETLAPYLSWNHEHYTRNLIDRTAAYEVIAICWEPGHVSSVHNHREQNCWMTVPIGRLRVVNYRVVYQNQDQGTCHLEKSDTLAMDMTHPRAVDPQEPVHCVHNPREFEQRAVSVHLYSRPFDSCIIYSPQQGTCREIELRYDTDYRNTTNPSS